MNTRVYDPISVYKGSGTYLRIGNIGLIQKEIQAHKELYNHGAPIPEIVKEGELDGQRFYIEKSVGDSLLTHVFSEDCKKKGKISDHNFSVFLILTKRFAEAQLSTMTPAKRDENFYRGIYMDYALDDFPKFKNKLLEAFEKIRQRISVFPVVLTHGDLNPHNFLSGGIIDFGYTFNGFAGYDLVGNIYHTYFFPKQGGYEKMRLYNFTEKQFDSYFRTMDELYSQKGLPKLSEYQDDFLIAKIIWTSARITGKPKIQNWRFNLLERSTINYLRGEPIIETVKEFLP